MVLLKVVKHKLGFTCCAFSINKFASGPTTKIGTLIDVTPKSLNKLKVYEVPANVMNAYKLNILLTIRNQVFTIKVQE